MLKIALGQLCETAHLVPSDFAPWIVMFISIEYHSHTNNTQLALGLPCDHQVPMVFQKASYCCACPQPPVAGETTDRISKSPSG